MAEAPKLPTRILVNFNCRHWKMDAYEVEVNPERIMNAVTGKADHLLGKMAKRVKETWTADVDVSVMMDNIQVIWHDIANGTSGRFSILHPPFHRSDLEILLPDILRLQPWINGKLEVTYNARITPRRAPQSTETLFLDIFRNGLPSL